MTGPIPSPAATSERASVTRAVFEAEIMPGYAPVVMRQLCADWPSLACNGDARTMAGYLAALSNDRPVEVFVGPPAMRGRFFYAPDFRGLNFERRRIQLPSVLGKLVELAGEPDPIHLYAGGVSAAEHLPGFTAAHPMPLVPDTVGPRIWVGNATSVAPHYDLAHNVAVCVAGTRRFTLFPPEQVRNLYVGPIENTVAGQPASLVDLDEPDLGRFPRFIDALSAAQEVVLQPGDALYVPPLWWHGVRSTGKLGVLVNYWWGQATDSSPFEALIHGLLAIRDLPGPERAAWRAAFDHYVFDPEVPDHLPQAARGVLGAASRRRSELMRAFLIGAISGRR